MNLATKETKITAIHACCNMLNKYAGVSQDGEKLVWMYYDKYLKTSQEEISEKIQVAQTSKQKNNNSFYGKKHSLETIEKLR